MERYDVGEDARLAAIVDAVDRGEEVLITRGGTVVAEVMRAPAGQTVAEGVLDLDALALLRGRVRLLPGSGAELVRELRDERDW